MAAKYPFKWVPIDDKDKAEKFKLFPLENSVEVDMVKSIPGDVYMPSKYAEVAEKIYNFPLRPDDVWIVTYPKCGTTWTQEILWLLKNDLDKDGAEKIDASQRVPFLEICSLISPQFRKPGLPPHMLDSINFADQLPRDKPRVIKSHMPLEFLPPKLLDTCKGQAYN